MKNSLLYIALILTTLLKAQLPAFQWVKGFGSRNMCGVGKAIAVDVSGNVYTTGGFEGTVDFDPGAGTYTLSAMAQSDAFISKADNSGNFIWSKSVGGAILNEFGTSIAVDAAGNIYVCGAFTSVTDFDPGIGVVTATPTPNGVEDVFILKLDQAGNFVWVKTFGGAFNEDALSIAVDGASNVYVAGWYNDLAPVTVGSFVLPPTIGSGSASNSPDIFILKIDAQANIAWVRTYGGGYDEIAYSLDLDTLGNVYVAGSFKGPVSFAPGPGSTVLSSADYDAFILKLDGAGNCLWVRNVGGPGYDGGRSISVDASGNAYTAGFFESTGDFDPGAGTVNLTSAGVSDVFVSKLDASGNFVWAKDIGGPGYDRIHCIASDPAGNVYLSGAVENTLSPIDFDPGPGTYTLVSSGDDGLYVLKLNPQGNFLAAAVTGKYFSIPTHAAADAVGNLYITGAFGTTTDFNFGWSTNTLTPLGMCDIFTLKMGSTPLGMGEPSDPASNFCHLYPNPASNSFRLRCHERGLQTEVEVLDNLGQILMRQHDIYATTELNVSGLPPGLYIVKILVDGKPAGMQKLLKH